MKPATLIFDIETSHDILASYGLREQYHHPKNILQNWYMICVCWKWLDAKKINNASLLDDMDRFNKDPSDDYAVVKTLHEVISEAEVIVGHNMAGFDWKKFYARVIYHKLPPIHKPLIVDTLKETRKIALFSSNKMSFLAKHLNVERKQEHSDDMWLRILRGEEGAVKECVSYCRGDVVTTEALYLRLRPYMEYHPNNNLWRGDGIECCKKCSSENISKNGSIMTATGKYQRYRCGACGAWMRGTKLIKRVAIK